MRGPRHLHEFIGALSEVEVAHADAAVFPLGGDAAMGFAGFGLAGTH